MAALGLETYRFSIAWPRVQPEGRGRAQPARARLLRPAGRGAARARHRALGDAVPLGPAAGAAGRGRLGGARHRRALRRVRGADGRPAGRPSCAAGSPTTSRGWSRSSGTPTGVKAPGIRDWPTAAARLPPPAALARAGGAGAARRGGPRAGRDHAQPRRRCARRRARRRPRRGAPARRPPQPLVPRSRLRGAYPRRHDRAARGAATARSTWSATATSTSSPPRSTSSASTTTCPKRVRDDPRARPARPGGRRLAPRR